MPLTLWRHQTAMIDHIMSRSASLCYSGMSTGKTVVALEVARRHRATLILSPVAALPVYREDVESYYTPRDFDLYVLDKGNAKSKLQTIRDHIGGSRAAVFVVGYETAARMDLRDLDFDLVIADEAHKLAAYNSKQALHLSRHLANVPRKVAMTGTPWTDHIASLYGLFRFLETVVHDNPRKYPTSQLFGSYDDFLHAYCNTFEIAPHVRAISSYKNLDRMAGLIRPYVFIVRTQDVHDLPPIVAREYLYPVRGEALRVYTEMADDAAVEINDDLVFAPNVLTQLLRLRQIASCGAFALPDGTESLLPGLEHKVAIYREIIDELGGQPAVTFCSFDFDVAVITAALDRAKVTYSHLTGKVNTLEEWQRGETQILIANMAAGSVGVRLDRASHAVYWSVSFSATHFVQSTGRLRRNTQKAHTVYHHYLTADLDDGIDRQIMAALRAKLGNEKGLRDRIQGA